jgi:hypothetical protein
LPGLARTLLPLTDALKGGVKGASIVLWTADMVAAFTAAKAALCAATTLVHPDSAADISIMVDASATHVGQSFSSGGEELICGIRLAFSQKS